MRSRPTGFSIRGRSRQVNDDAFIWDETLGLCAVCDGLPSNAAGPTAAARALDALVHHLRDHAGSLTEQTAGASLREAFEIANDVLFEAGQRSGTRLVTTCTALLLVGSTGFLAHVGTSRMYLLRDGRLELLTDDHNYQHEAVRNGILSPRRALASPYARRLTRALGMRDTISVDTLRIPLLGGDRLLLCTDGVYEALGTLDPRRLLSSDDQDPARTLVQMTHEAHGDDDATAVVLAIDTAAAAAPDRKRRVGAALEAIANVPLFADLTLRERYTILDLFRPLSVGPAHPVVRQGDRGDSLFVMLDGRVDVRRGAQRVATLGPGSHFGEMALLSNRPRSATVTARAPTELLELGRDAFLDLVARDSTIGAKILWRLAQQLSLRLDDLYALVPDQGRETAVISLLSPFETAPAKVNDPSANGSKGAGGGNGA